MALTRLENGELVDAADLNTNFNYLDGKIDSTKTSITGGSNKTIDQLNSDISSVNSYIQSGGAVPTGTVIMHAGNAAPAGYLLCNGVLVAKAAYPNLFNVIGYKFGGSGDNFNLPLITDYRFIRGAATTGYEDYVSETKTLSVGGTTSWDGDHTHTVRKPTSQTEMQSGTAGGHNHTWGGSAAYTDTFNPKSIALLPCIKY